MRSLAPSRSRVSLRKIRQHTRQRCDAQVKPISQHFGEPISCSSSARTTPKTPPTSQPPIHPSIRRYTLKTIYHEILVSLSITAPSLYQQSAQRKGSVLYRVHAARMCCVHEYFTLAVATRRRFDDKGSAAVSSLSFVSVYSLTRSTHTQSATPNPTTPAHVCTHSPLWNLCACTFRGILRVISPSRRPAETCPEPPHHTHTSFGQVAFRILRDICVHTHFVIFYTHS